MKTIQSTTLLGIIALLAWSPAQADDINSILQQINSETSGGQNTALRKTADQTQIPKKKKASAQKKKQDVEEVQEQVTQIKIWNPDDKLPKDIAGQGVAGDFAVMGEAPTGGAVLVPGNGGMNPFARQFIVTNLSSGMAAGTIVPVYWRKHVQVSADRPLIIIGRGAMPGSYMVEAQ
jgi:hypothetical protein